MPGQWRHLLKEATCCQLHTYAEHRMEHLMEHKQLGCEVAVCMAIYVEGVHRKGTLPSQWLNSVNGLTRSLAMVSTLKSLFSALAIYAIGVAKVRKACALYQDHLHEEEKTGCSCM